MSLEAMIAVIMVCEVTGLLLRLATIGPIIRQTKGLIKKMDESLDEIDDADGWKKS